MKVANSVLYGGLVVLTLCSVQSVHGGIFSVLSSILGSAKGSVYNTPPPEAFMSTPDLIRNANYTVETHKVTTADGYILTMFRIPHGKNSTVNTKEPVIVQHGLLCSSNDWLLLDNEDNLPYLLADDGHDVWLGNCRGNNYSLEHVNLTQNDNAFWDFSFHEMGKYDIPAVLAYVINQTGYDQVSYVGHSMGTTMFYIAMDQHPELNQKVKKFGALAPAIYIKHARTPLALLAATPSPVLSGLFNLTSGGRIIPAQVNQYLKQYGPLICGGSIPAALCENVLFLIAGYDYNQTTPETASMVTGHTPSDASIKTLNHYLQFVRLESFRQYDYGILGNMARYNASVPPTYNLAANIVPSWISFGLNDWLAGPIDTERAIRESGNVVYNATVADPNWNHLDFTYGKDAHELVYQALVAWLGAST